MPIVSRVVCPVIIRSHPPPSPAGCQQQVFAALPGSGLTCAAAWPWSALDHAAASGRTTCLPDGGREWEDQKLSF